MSNTWVHFIDDTIIHIDSITICGLEFWREATLSWDKVTCPNCLKHKPKE